MDAKISVGIFNSEQLMVVKKMPGAVHRIVLDYDLFLNCDEMEIVELKQKFTVYVSLPAVFRLPFLDIWEKIAQRLIDRDIEGIVIHDLDELAWAKASLPGFKILTDIHIYIQNSMSAAVLQKLAENKITEFTYGVELDKGQLIHLSELITDKFDRSNLLIYGRLPMMISAGCVKRTYNRCDHHRELNTNTYLKDRINHNFPVLTDCNICSNVIINDRPLSLHNNLDLIDRLKVDYCSINFTVETPKETDVVLRAFVFNDEEALDEIRKINTTTGHLKRGV